MSRFLFVDPAGNIEGLRSPLSRESLEELLPPNAADDLEDLAAREDEGEGQGE
jgi:hypothetical protein